MMKTWIAILSLSLLSSVSFANNAGVKLPGNIAVHITKNFYEHPTRLLHPYLDVWHMKGPSAEKASQKVLSDRFANIEWCNQAKNAEVLLVLEPHITYNPQLRRYYAEYTAKVYTQTLSGTNLEPSVVKFTKHAYQNGDLSITPEYTMQKAYEKAMKEVVKELEVNKVFLSSLNSSQTKNVEKICPALDEFSPSKIYY